MKVFVLNTFYKNDYCADCDAAIVEDTPALRQMIRERVATVKALKAANPTLWAVHFWDYNATYVSRKTLSLRDIEFDYASEVAELDIAAFDDEGERTECEEMVVCDDAVYWKCEPKHSEVEVHTAEISVKYLDELEAAEMAVQA